MQDDSTSDADLNYLFGHQHLHNDGTPIQTDTELTDLGGITETIASVVYNNCGLPSDRCREIAAALVETLSIRPEFGLCEAGLDEPTLLFDERQEMKDKESWGETAVTRWTTPWQSIDSESD